MGDAAGGAAVKICGVTRPEDAAIAAREGAAFVGAVVAPGSPRRVDAATAARFLPDPGGDEGPELVLVAVDADPGALVEAAGVAGAGVLQLHGDEAPGTVARLRDAGPWEVWKAAAVRSATDVREVARRYGEVADGLLLDAHDPRRAGGTGRRFAWDEAAEALEEVPRDVRLIVAGGLTPSNVAAAVALFRPDVVDVSSGVEARPGIKDPEKVAAFVAAVRESTRRGR